MPSITSIPWNAAPSLASSAAGSASTSARIASNPALVFLPSGRSASMNMINTPARVRISSGRKRA